MTLPRTCTKFLDDLARSYVDVEFDPHDRGGGSLELQMRIPFGTPHTKWVLSGRFCTLPLPSRFIARFYAKDMDRWAQREVFGKLPAYTAYWKRALERARLQKGLEFDATHWTSPELRDLAMADLEAAVDRVPA